MKKQHQADNNEALGSGKISDSHYRGMVESTAGIPWEVDMATFQFTYVGPQAEKILGYPVEDWYQTDFWGEHIHPEDREAALEFCIEASQRGEDYQFDYRMIHRDGRSVWILDYVNIVSENGRPVRLQGFMFDVTEERQREQQLRDKNSLLAALYEASPDMIFIHADDGRILDVNRNAAQRFGYSAAEMRQRSVADLSADSLSLSEAVTHVQAALRNEEPEFEWLARDKSGKSFPVEVRLRRLGEDGGPDDPAVVAVVREITERRQIEDAIRNIAAGVSAQTGKGLYQQLVKYLAQMFQADHAFIALLDEHDCSQAQTLALWSRGQLADNIRYQLVGSPCANVLGDTTCCHAQGVQADYPEDALLVEMQAESYIGTPLFDQYHRPIGILAVIDSKPMRHTRQISEIFEIFAARISAELERERTEQRLQVARQRLALHVELTPLGIIEWDMDFRVTDWNPAAERIFGYTREEALGRHARDLIVAPEHLPHVDRIWRELMRNLGGTRSQNSNITRDGKNIICEWYNTPLVTRDGRVIGVASMVDDISERIHTEAELARHREHLEEMVEHRTEDLSMLNRELKSFGHTISHDLRAPLRHIEGFTRILLEDYAEQLPDEGTGLLNRIRGNITHMGQLIESMLQLSRINDVEIQDYRVDLSKLAGEIAEKLQSEDTQRQVSFDIEAGLTGVGDPSLLQSVLENLIGNAWKYTATTDVARIRFGRADDMPEVRGRTVYRVCDNGVGFDMQYADMLFNTFQRLHSAEQFEGTGVGLATVQRIIHRHGGKVWAESDPGRETCFYFTLGNH